MAKLATQESAPSGPDPSDQQAMLESPEGPAPSTTAAPSKNRLSVWVNRSLGVSWRMFKFGRRSYWGSIINLSNTCLGTGVLQMPYVYRRSGMGLGTLWLLLFLYATDLSLKLLIKSGARMHLHSYPALAFRFYGKWGEIFVLINLILLLFGACVTYVVIMADMLAPVAVAWSNSDPSPVLTSPWFLVPVFCLFMVFPFALLRRLHRLTVVSLISLLCLALFIGCVVLRTLQRLSFLIGGTWEYGRMDGTSTLSLPVIALAYNCHFNMFAIVNELQRPTLHRIKYVVRSSLLFSSAVYVIVGFFGYLAFSKHTLPNFIHNYNTADSILNAIRLLFTGMIAFSFPLVSTPLREYVSQLVFRVILQNTKKRTTTAHVTMTALILVLSLSVGLISRDLLKVSAITGSVPAFLIAYVCPPLFYLRTQRVKNPNAPFKPKMLLPWLLLAFGVIAGIISTIVVILSYANQI